MRNISEEKLTKCKEEKPNMSQRTTYVDKPTANNKKTILAQRQQETTNGQQEKANVSHGANRQKPTANKKKPTSKNSPHRGKYTKQGKV